MSSLSKFAICLSDQGLQHSPLMGNIANIVAQRLSSIDDIRLVMRHILSDDFKYKYVILCSYSLTMFSQDSNYADD